MKVLLGGDWRFFWPDTLTALAHMPSAWDSYLNTGLGQPALGTLWITGYLHFTSIFSYFGLSWFWIGLLFWQVPALFLSFWGAFLIGRKVLTLPYKYSILCGLLFLTNTYFLMLFVGGQAGIALSYGVVPFALYSCLTVLSRPTLKNSIVFGLVLSLLLLFDPRIFFLTGLALFLAFLFFGFNKKFFLQVAYGVLLPGIVLFSLHFFWIFPVLLYRTTGVGEVVGSIQSFQFLSFGGFDYAFSLLHPNWPENIFGKITFLNPLFLFFPLLAFSALFFVRKKEKRYIVYFTLLAIVSAFLAKGAKEPFSTINIFLFQNVPGMQLFRDATKFYILIAIAYATLIPYTLFAFHRYVKGKEFYSPVLFEWGPVILLVVFCGGLFYPITRHTNNFFISIPQSYEEFSHSFTSQSQFSRSLWLPGWQRFGYFSPRHPAIGRQELLKDTSVKGIKNFFAKKDAASILQDWSIQYVIIPDDSQKEFFLNDYRYDERKKKAYEAVLDRVSWLRKSSHFSPLAVYEVNGYKDHFRLQTSNQKLITDYYSPSKYRVTAKNGTIQGNLIFSETFDKNWYATVGEKTILSQERNGQNSFVLPPETEQAIIEYKPQQEVNRGIIVSLVSLIGWLGVLVYLRKSH